MAKQDDIFSGLSGISLDDVLGKKSGCKGSTAGGTKKADKSEEKKASGTMDLDAAVSALAEIFEKRDEQPKTEKKQEKLEKKKATAVKKEEKKKIKAAIKEDRGKKTSDEDIDRMFKESVLGGSVAAPTASSTAKKVEAPKTPSIEKKAEASTSTSIARKADEFIEKAKKEVEEEKKTPSESVSDSLLKTEEKGKKYADKKPTEPVQRVKVAEGKTTLLKTLQAAGNEPCTEKEVVFAFGEKTSGGLLGARLNASNLCCALVFGNAGSGKTNALSTLMLALAKQYNKEKLEFFVADFLCSGLDCFKKDDKRKTLFVPQVSRLLLRGNGLGLVELLSYAETEIVARKRMLEVEKVASVVEYNSVAAKRGLKKLPLLLFVFEGLTDAVKAYGEKNAKGVKRKLVELVKAARGLNVAFIVSDVYGGEAEELRSESSLNVFLGGYPRSHATGGLYGAALPAIAKIGESIDYCGIAANGEKLFGYLPLVSENDETSLSVAVTIRSSAERERTVIEQRIDD